MRRIVSSLAIATTAVLVTAGCSAGSGGSSGIDKSAPDKLSGTVSLWHFFSDQNADVMKQVVASFEKKYPDVKVELHDGQDDTKVQKAISAGQPIDVAVSSSSQPVGSFCSSGAFRDLQPFIDRDKVDLDDIPPAVRDYTQYKGKRCTLPMLADSTGMFYNTDLFKAAGIASPPKTLEELEADGLALTKYNPDGSIRQLGFNPLIDFYENGVGHWQPMINGTFLNADGTSAIGGSDAWKKLITWQKAYVDRIGYAKLRAFTSGLGQESQASNAFFTGQVAITIDGEWRVGKITKMKPGLPYATAPSPVMDGVGKYGASSITGNVAGIGRGSKVPELAWALLKYLTTDTAVQVELGNGVSNIPTLTSALKSPDLKVSPVYKTFVVGAADPHTVTFPATPDGAAYLQTFQKAWADYQEKGGDVNAFTANLDITIDNASKLAGP